MARRRRPANLQRTVLQVWAAAAGRCTFCNRVVFEDEDLGEPVPIGEMAHNIGWSENSPRGKSSKTDEDRRSAGNLILACRNCHKPVDDGGSAGRYTVEQLTKLKHEHEIRIRRLTEIGADRSAFVVRVAGNVRSVPVELSRETVLAAATAAGVFPHPLRRAHWDDIELDLRNHRNLDSRDAFERCVPEITDLVGRIHDGVAQDQITRVAVFAFARIPLLVSLGAQLDDKLEALIFQRQRTEGENAWMWPPHVTAAATFHTELAKAGSDPSAVTLVVNLSGTIDLSELPEDATSANVYVLSPSQPAEPGPSLIDSAETLGNFERTLRDFIALVERTHGRPDRISLFAAVPVSAAVTLGRVLMPDVSPAWLVYDRNTGGDFFEALEIRR